MSTKKRLLPELLPVIGIEREVLLPGAPISLRIEDPRGMSMVEAHLWNEGTLKGKYIGLVPRESKTAQFHHIGTAASITKVTGRSYPTPHFRLALNGLCRFRIDEFKQEHPYVVAKVTQLDYLPNETLPSDLQPQITEFKTLASQFFQLLHLDNPTIKRILGVLSDQELPDFLSSLLVTASFEEKLKLLDAVEFNKRIKLALSLLHRQIATLKLQGSPQREERREAKHNQFPLGLGWSVPGNKKVRGQPGGTDDEMIELEERLKAANLPSHAHKVAQKELERLRGLPTQFPEHAVLRTYLETVLELPWATSTSDTLDLQQAAQQLDKDHYGLKKVKQRILEFLAVRKLRNSLKGPILCFVGAPGVGKTSVGRSVAATLGRKFHRISLGGISDQAEVRGHRRTYIGAIPGRILQGLKTVGVNNPVFLLDEVDKLYRGLHGDPAAALLEVLDPEQNNSFVDHYLNIPFDLSQVMFIATANTKSDIPRPLLDRMEIIEVPGYTVEEKVEIARRHLLPKQLEQHGIGRGKLEIPVPVLDEIVSSFTAEAGVRQLERMLAAVCRSVAVKLAQGEVSDVITVSTDQLEDILGPPPYSHDVCERLTRPGVSVGLAWTGQGGEIMFVETSKMEGSGELVLTGQLGDVMKESAQIALNWIRSSSQKYGWACGGLEKTDVHLHFPAGAVGKDGPSAGCAIVVALVSLFSGCCVRSDTAMTGEMTLRGLVLPVGGVVEKVLAAHRAGIRHVMLPRKNLKDLVDISDTVKKLVKFTPVDNIEDVLQGAFDGGIPYQTVRSKL